jgi:uncharacterized repeat protein (TIGR01451 family)/LPXTG-motif cell wall-anchored protein
MKKLITAIKRAPKTAASISMVLAAVVVPAAIFAWGPDRPTYTMDSPADHVTFNSITNNPTHGDERNFVQIKDVTAGTRFVENVNLVPGHEYEVYSFYHNNAASNLNAGGRGVAKNAQMRVQMPATVKSNETVNVTGIVSASNAQPQQVWDEAYGKATNGDVVLRYVQESATIHNNGTTNGQKLPDTLLTTGTNLGFNALNGDLPGCNEFSGYVTFRFKVGQPNFEVKKTVSEKGKNDFKESISVAPGAEVEYKIEYTNTGTTQQDDVVIRDELPAGVTYNDKYPTLLSTGLSNGYQDVKDHGITARGINIGSYQENGGNAFVKFSAKVADNNKLAKCGKNTLTNKAIAETANGSKSDTAVVIVTKTCVPVTPTKPVTPVTPTTPVVTPVTPAVPAELPKTGNASGILSLVGLGSIVAAISYYVASRRTLS